MVDRDTEYILVQNKKPKKTPRQYRYKPENDDDDDDDDDSQLYQRVARTKPHKEQRLRYMSSDEIESDRRKQSSDPRIKVRKTSNGDQVILDEDDNVIKVIRNSRSPSPTSINPRRLRRRPRESQSVWYETPDNHISSRPSKKSSIHTKKTQVVYADDTPIKILKKVIIDPRTGDRETIYEKDRPRKQQKFFLQQRPTELSFDSDDSDDQQQPQYVRVPKHRKIHNDVLPRHEPAKYFMIKKRSDSEPVYALTSKMPAIKSNRRVFYEAPSKKPLTTYIYPNEKYYK